MNNWKSDHKPKMIDIYILNLIKAPIKPHYKTYLNMKISSISWNTRKELKNYLIKNYQQNPDKYGYISNRYYHGTKYLVNYIYNNYAWEGNQVKNPKKTEYSSDQLYVEFKEIVAMTI